MSLKYLKQLNSHANSIIVTSQVEMEFLKHRQEAILESLKNIKTVEFPSKVKPAVLDGVKAFEMLSRHHKNATSQQSKLKKRIESILKNPSVYDPVHKELSKLFKMESIYNLTRDHEHKDVIKEKAWKRWVLGYPPRKDKDNSIGDAINWEWIIRCADQSKGKIIIVTRDSDFGVSYENDLILNDWLKKEFTDRLSQKRKLLITNRLTSAFKELNIPVTTAMKDEESDRLSESSINTGPTS